MQKTKTLLFQRLTKSAPCHEGIWDMEININSLLILGFRKKYLYTYLFTYAFIPYAGVIQGLVLIQIIRR
jgi:hypothetical protein